jgi:hypothetical protein
MSVLIKAVLITAAALSAGVGVGVGIEFFGTPRYPNIPTWRETLFGTTKYDGLNDKLLHDAYMGSVITNTLAYRTPREQDVLLGGYQRYSAKLRNGTE